MVLFIRDIPIIYNHACYMIVLHSVGVSSIDNNRSRLSSMASRSVLFFIALTIITQCYVEIAETKKTASSADVGTTTEAGAGTDTTLVSAEEVMSTTSSNTAGDTAGDTPGDTASDLSSGAAAVTSPTPEKSTLMTSPGFVPREDFDCTDPLSCVNDYTAGLPGDADITAIICEHRDAIKECVALMIQNADEESDCVLPDSSIRTDLSTCNDGAEEIGDGNARDGLGAVEVATECMSRIQSCFSDPPDPTTGLSIVELCRTQMETIDCVFDVTSSDYCRSNPYVQETLPSHSKTRLLQNYQCAKYMSCSSSAISECVTLSDIIVADSESDADADAVAGQTALCTAYNQTVGCTESLEDSCKSQWLSTGAIADLYSDVNIMCQDVTDADDCAYSTDPLQCIEDYSATFDITNPDPETKCLHKTEIMTCVELMEVYHNRHQCISPDPAIRSALSTCPDDIDGEDPTAALEASSCLFAVIEPCGASSMFEEDHVMLFNDPETCRTYMEQVTCMIEHLTNSICSSNILILQQIEAFSMTRMYMNYKCTSTLECSREMMSSCITDPDVFNSIEETDPLGAMDNMEELCTAFNESVACTASLPPECRSTWVTEEELLAMAHDASLCEDFEIWDCSNAENEFVCTSGEFNTDVENNYCLNKNEILDCVTQLEERARDDGCVGPSPRYRSHLAECPPETTLTPNDSAAAALSAQTLILSLLAIAVTWRNQHV